MKTKFNVKKELLPSIIILITAIIILSLIFFISYSNRNKKETVDKVENTPETTISKMYDAFTKKDYGEIFDYFYLDENINYSKEDFIEDMTELENTGLANERLISSFNIVIPEHEDEEGNISTDPTPINLDDLTKILDIVVMNIGDENTISNKTTCNVLIKVKLFKILSLSGQVKAIKVNNEWKIASESIGVFVSRMLPS